MDRPDLAQKIFYTLQKNSKKIPAEWYLTMGMASQENTAFEEADRYYRRFVREADKNTDYRKVRYRMLQAGGGMKYPAAQTTRVVESRGAAVNSNAEEVAAVD